MIYDFKIWPKAAEEIKNIKFYIKYVLNATKASDEFEKALLEKIELIRKEPHLYPAEKIGAIVYRKAVVKQFIIAFYIDETTKTVHIAAVGHTRRKRINLIKG